MKSSSKRQRLSRLPAAAFFGTGATTPPWYRTRVQREPVRSGAMPVAYGPWTVVRVLGSGQPQVVNGGMCYEAAEKLAGAMRDQTTDSQVAAGWNYLPRKATQRGPVSLDSKEERRDPTLHKTTAPRLEPRRRLTNGRAQPAEG